MDAVKNFEVAVEEAPEEVDLSLKYGITVLGETYAMRAITKGESQMWLLYTAGRENEAYRETANLVRALMHDSTWDNEDGSLSDETPEDFDPDEQFRSVQDRWRDVRDPLAIEHFLKVIFWLIEQRSANPTSSPSASRSGQRASGTSSTAASPRKASTRSRSPRTASTT